MRGKVAKELRRIAKNMCEVDEGGAVALAYTGGAPPQYTQTPSGQYMKTSKGIPKVLDKGCVRALYKLLKRKASSSP